MLYVMVTMRLESRLLPRRQPVPHGDCLGIVLVAVVLLVLLLAFRLVEGGWHQHCFFIKKDNFLDLDWSKQV